MLFSVHLGHENVFFLLKIEETNLKKQGILPLRFSNPSDYDKIKPSDRISLLNLSALAPEKVNKKFSN
jgi:aconitate hydratase